MVYKTYVNVRKSNTLISNKCMYCICIGNIDEYGKSILKIGASDEFRKYLKEQREKYIYTKLICVIALQDVNIEFLEEYLENAILLEKITVDELKNEWCYACDTVEVDRVIESLINESDKYHREDIQEIYFSTVRYIGF